MSLDLAGRYRLLLACYPREHRRVYGEEMLGVLLAGASPGQRRPSMADSADLLLGAAGLRLVRGREAAARPPWTDAAAVAALIFAMTGCAIQLVGVAGGVVLRGRGMWVRVEDPFILVGLVAVIGAALVGLGRIAVALAGTVLVCQVGSALLGGGGSYPSIVTMVSLTFSAGAVVTLLVASGAGGETATDGRRRKAGLGHTLGLWRTLCVGAAALVGGGTLQMPFVVFHFVSRAVALPMLFVAPFAAAVIVLAVAAPVRRGVLAMLTGPAVALLAWWCVALTGAPSFLPRLEGVPVVWCLALLAGPVLVSGAAVTAIGCVDRTPGAWRGRPGDDG